MTRVRLALAAFTMLVLTTGCATPQDGSPRPIHLEITTTQDRLLIVRFRDDLSRPVSRAEVHGVVYLDGSGAVAYQLQERVDVGRRGEVVLGIVPRPDRRRQNARRNAGGSAPIAARAW